MVRMCIDKCCVREYKQNPKQLADRFTDTLTYRRFNVHEYEYQ
jgi:hypothetical protein